MTYAQTSHLQAYTLDFFTPSTGHIPQTIQQTYTPQFNTPITSYQMHTTQYTTSSLVDLEPCTSQNIFAQGNIHTFLYVFIQWME